MDPRFSETGEGCLLDLGDEHSQIEIKDEQLDEERTSPDKYLFVSNGLANTPCAPTNVSEERTSTEQNQWNLYEGTEFHVSNQIKRQEMHSGEKPYQCSHCDEYFACITTLEQHMEVHIKGKTYEFAQCEKNSHNKSDIEEFQKIHTGETLYNCVNCEEDFTYNYTLEQLKKINSGENFLQCNDCVNKKIGQKKTKRKHVSLTLEKKMEVLKRLEKGDQIENIMKEYNIGKTTVYEIKKDANNILREIERCDLNDVSRRKNKRTLNEPDDNQNSKGFGQKKAKRKHVSLTLEKKIEVLKRLEKKETIVNLMKEYNIGRATVYEIKKGANKIMKEANKCDSNDVLKRRKNMRNSRNIELDRILYEWIKQMRNKGEELSDIVLKNKAKEFNEQLNCDHRNKQLQFSYGWLSRFKARHGLTDVSLSRIVNSIDHQEADNYKVELESLRNFYKLTDEQIFYCNGTGLFWRFIGENMFAMQTYDITEAFKDNEDLLTLLACTNQAGTFKNKLVVIGKSKNPIAFRGAHLPVNWYSSKNAYMTERIFSNWIKNKFLPEARKHLLKVGLGATCKIVLILHYCNVYPSAEYLENLDVQRRLIVKLLPPNVTSLTEQMEHGILLSLKFNYKFKFIISMIKSLNKGETIVSFLNTYSILQAVYALYSSWMEIPQSRLKRSWQCLLTPLHEKCKNGSVNKGIEEAYQGFQSVSVEEEQSITKILDYSAKMLVGTSISFIKEDIIEVLDADRDAATVQILQDNEIVPALLLEKEDLENDDYYGDKPGYSCEEELPIEELIHMCDKLLIGIQRKKCIPGEDVMGIFRIKQLLAKESMEQILKTNKEGSMKSWRFV